MSDELFKIGESLSPRWRWLDEHDVKTWCSGPAEFFDGEPWNAWAGDLDEAIGSNLTATGATEDDAICALAKLHGWRLWNETGAETTGMKN